MPKLTIVIGGNGAGKTTWCRHHRDRLPGQFYNADSIAEGIGDWNSPRTQAQARRLVDNRIRGHLGNDDDFGFESTYSGKARPDVVLEAKRLGYRTHAILIGTESAAVNAERVAARVAAGTGHHVPLAEVERRWTASQDNLVRTAKAIDVVDLVDNTEPQARLITRIRDGRPTSPATPTPEWAAKLASRIADAWSAAGADAER